MKAAVERPGTSSRIQAGMTNLRLEAHYRCIRADSTRGVPRLRDAVKTCYTCRGKFAVCFQGLAPIIHGRFEAPFAPGNLSYYKLNRCENWIGHARKEQRQ